MYAQQNAIPQQHDTLSFYNSQFQTANGAHASNPNVAFTPNPAGATGVMQQKREFQGPPWGTGGYTDEGGLLQELEINIPHIRTKSFTVLNPLKTPDKHIMDDTDLAGPLFFCLLFGISLMLAGKVHFSYVYGIASFGVVGMYMIMNLMSENGIEFTKTCSVLGYCMLPMVLSSFIALVPFFGKINTALSVLAIIWSTYSSALLFTTVLSMRDQRFLVAYPLGLIYSCFALMTIF